jgi:hypothetical protein
MLLVWGFFLPVFPLGPMRDFSWWNRAFRGTDVWGFSTSSVWPVLHKCRSLRELARNWLNFRLVFWRLVDGVHRKRNDASVYSGHANPAPLALSSEGLLGLRSPLWISVCCAGCFQFVQGSCFSGRVSKMLNL